MVKVYFSIESEDEIILEKYHNLLLILGKYDSIDEVYRSVMEALPGQKAGIAFNNVYEVEIGKQEGVSELICYLQTILLPILEGKAKIKLRVEDLTIEFMQPSEVQLNLLNEGLIKRIISSKIDE